MKQRAQSNNAVRAAASATDARGWRLTIRGPSRTHSFMYSSTQPFGSRLLRQAYRPLGPSLSGQTPEATGLRSGLQSRTGSLRCTPGHSDLSKKGLRMKLWSPAEIHPSHQANLGWDGRGIPPSCFIPRRARPIAPRRRTRSTQRAGDRKADIFAETSFSAHLI